MSKYGHLPGIITYEQDWNQTFDITADGATYVGVAALNITDTHAYGESSVPVPSAGTFLVELQTKLEAALAATTPAVTSSVASWVLDETPYPKWRIDLQLDGVAEVIILDTGDSLSPLGIRPVTLTGKFNATDQGGNVWRLESNGYTAGIWAPGMKAKAVPDETNTARVSRSPFYPASVTKVLLATRTDYDLTYEYVDAAMRSSFERTQFPSMVTRAGLYLALRDLDTEGLLDQLITAAAANKGMRFHVEQGTYIAVDIDSDDLKTSNFATESTAGGIHYTVDLPLVGV